MRPPREFWLASGSAAAGITIASNLHPVAVAIGAVALVYLSTMCTLNWILSLPGPMPAKRLLRRLARSLVFLPAMAILPAPVVTCSWPAAAVGISVGLAGLTAQRTEMRRWLTPGRARLLGPLTRIDRVRDILHFSVGGAAQEYLYRYVVIMVATPILGAGSILISAALFVVEHLIQRKTSAWDTKDIIIHLLLGLSLGGSAYWSGSLLPAIIGHTIYNSPNVVIAVLRPKQEELEPSSLTQAWILET